MKTTFPGVRARLGLAILALATAGCAVTPSLLSTRPAPEPGAVPDALAPRTDAEIVGLAIPRYQLEPDYFERYGLVRPEAETRQLLSSFGAVAGPIPGLTTDQLAAFHRGGDNFSHYFLPVEGQGPLANSNSCATCHQSGGIGGAGHELVTRMGLVDMTDPNWMESSRGFYDMPELGGPVQQGEGGVVEPLPDQVMVDGLVAKMADYGTAIGRTVITSARSTPIVAGDGLLASVPDATLLAREALAKPFGIRGHVNRLSGYLGDLPLFGRFGRLGHKAQLPDNEAFFADAGQQELGITNPLNPFENSGGMPTIRVANTDVLADVADDFDAFCSGMSPPKPAQADVPGQLAFTKAGCAVCHYPGYVTGNSQAQLPTSLKPYLAALGNKPVPSYSDLLVHRMSREMADGFKMGTALGAEWRTTPLWGLRFKNEFLHDSRATSLEQAIALHKGPGSEANQVIDNYLGINALPGAANLTATEREALLRFLKKL